MAKQDDEQRKKKFLMLMGIGGAVLVIILTILISYFKVKPTQVRPVQPMKSTVTNSTTMAQQSWIAQSSSKLQEQTKQINDLNQKIEAMQRLEKEKSQQSQNQNNMDAKTLGLVPNGNSNSGAVNYPPPPPAPKTPPPAPAYQPSGHNYNNAPAESRQEDDLIGVVESSQSNSTSTSNKNPVPMSGTNTSTSPQSPQQHQQNNNKNSKESPMGFEIPPGSFVNAYLLTGADVPTSGNGEVGPIPVIFRVIGDAQMPNLYKSDIKSCFMLGQATGSLASERAFIRIDTLSCVTKSGKSIVKSMQGYATGSDGKVGLAGKVVSKQGSMLARVLVAGFVQGIGQAFQQGQQNISISPLGQTSSIAPDTNTILKYGIGGGVGQATTKLAEFYMKMANQMFPVIVINAGRTANIVFLKEVQF
jgi:conjugal transfer pilus assembly protein TraB